MAPSSSLAAAASVQPTTVFGEAATGAPQAFGNATGLQSINDVRLQQLAEATERAASSLEAISATLGASDRQMRVYYARQTMEIFVVVLLVAVPLLLSAYFTMPRITSPRLRRLAMIAWACAPLDAVSLLCLSLIRQSNNPFLYIFGAVPAIGLVGCVSLLVHVRRARIDALSDSAGALFGGCFGLLCFLGLGSLVIASALHSLPKDLLVFATGSLPNKVVRVFYERCGTVVQQRLSLVMMAACLCPHGLLMFRCLGLTHIDVHEPAPPAALIARLAAEQKWQHFVAPPPRPARPSAACAA